VSSEANSFCGRRSRWHLGPSSSPISGHRSLGPGRPATTCQPSWTSVWMRSWLDRRSDHGGAQRRGQPAGSRRRDSSGAEHQAPELLVMAAHVFSCVVRRDSGFAPNPFEGHCTIATCEPQIRRIASVGDCVLGTGSGTVTCSTGSRSRQVGDMTLQAGEAVNERAPLSKNRYGHKDGREEHIENELNKDDAKEVNHCTRPWHRRSPQDG